MHPPVQAEAFGRLQDRTQEDAQAHSEVACVRARNMGPF